MIEKVIIGLAVSVSFVYQTSHDIPTSRHSSSEIVDDGGE